MSLNGKYALITGSSRGIGRAIALKLAQHGVKVSIHYYQNQATANGTFSRDSPKKLPKSTLIPYNQKHSLICQLTTRDRANATCQN